VETAPETALTVEEAERVFALPDLSTLSGVRDQAMIETFYGTGIRRAELARLNWRDLDVQRRTLMVRQVGTGRSTTPRTTTSLDRS
jgi:integrase/recombinase XerD